MFSLSGTSSDYINHFRCITDDITANKHIPDSNGYVHPEGVTKVKLINGDELYCMDNGNTYLYDEENKLWLVQ